MLAFITTYWLMTLPAVATSFFLLALLKRHQEEKMSPAQVRATITSNKQ